MSELILFLHVFFGMICLLASVWVFADVLNASVANERRIKKMSVLGAIAMWFSFEWGGFWYIAYYKSDRAIVLKGPWPFAHNFVMETKEHLVIMLLLLATFLPVVAANNLAANQEARRLILWVSGLIILLALIMEGEGALIAMGVKIALLQK